MGMTTLQRMLGINSQSTIVSAKKLLLLGLLLATCVVTVPFFMRARTTTAVNACVNNLRQLDGAKQQWQLVNQKTTNDTPTLKDLAPYLGPAFACPNGGIYTPERVGQPPRCSIGGTSHTLPQ
jgi:hypothetical protein